MVGIVAFVVGNYFLTLPVLGLIAAGVSLARKRGPRTPSVVVDELLAYWVLFAVGLAYLVNFVFHVFLGEMAASLIGWAQSPFQAEVGFASLGFGAIGVMAFRGGFGLRAAAVVGTACFSLGAAGGHVYQMVVNDNFSPDNAGVVFFTDIGIPIVGFVLLLLAHRLGTEAGPTTGGRQLR